MCISRAERDVGGFASARARGTTRPIGTTMTDNAPLLAAAATAGAVLGAGAAVWLGCGGGSGGGEPGTVSAQLAAARQAFGDGSKTVMLQNVSLQLESLAPGLELQNLPGRGMETMPTDALPAADPDAPGLVRADVLFGPGGLLLAVSAPGGGFPGGAKKAGATVVECEGRIAWPCLTDAHTHLMKTNTMPRCSNPTCTISDAMLCEECDQPRWTKADMATRMDFSLRCAYAHGTAAMRCHLDGVGPADPALSTDTYAVFDEARAVWRGRIALQGVANLFLPLWADSALADAHVAEAVKHDGVVLGAYCGMRTKDADVGSWFDALFDHARKVDLPVDLHIDETNDVSGGLSSCSLVVAAISLAKARAAGYTQPVVCGHCSSASLLPSGDLETVIGAVKAAGNVTVCMNPLTNTSLQDRRGQTASVGTAIDRDTPRTPTWRGITAVQELAAAGVAVAAASDNVRDHWHRYGDYDLLEVFGWAVKLAHLDTAPCAGKWASMVGSTAANALGDAESTGLGEFSVGKPADFMLFEARRYDELLSRPQSDRVVVRSGVAISGTLPSYSELDLLVRF